MSNFGIFSVMSFTFFSRCIFFGGDGEIKLCGHRGGFEINVLHEVRYGIFWGFKNVKVFPLSVVGVGFIFPFFRGAVVGFIFYIYCLFFFYAVNSVGFI